MPSGMGGHEGAPEGGGDGALSSRMSEGEGEGEGEGDGDGDGEGSCGELAWHTSHVLTKSQFQCSSLHVSVRACTVAPG